MEGGRDPQNPSLQLLPTFLLHLRPPGCGSFTPLPWRQTVMSQTQGLGLSPPQGVSGGSVTSDGVDCGSKPSRRPKGRQACGPDPGSSKRPARAALSSLEDRCSRSFLSWLSISVILFCFLKISTSLSSRRRDVLAVPFFCKRSVGRWVGAGSGLRLGRVSLEGEQREGRSWQRAPCGLSEVFK